VLKRTSPGFTVLELAIATTVFGILAAVAIPNYLSLVRDVRAAQAVADVQAVRAAAYLYFGDNGEWPPEEEAGVIPAPLAPYLPKNMEFFRSAYRVDWDNWIVHDDHGGGGGGTGMAGKGHHSKYPKTGIMVGISLVSTDREILRAARGLLGNAPIVEVAPNRSTLVVAGIEGF
jgi:prepilin-type N-terminal cleavage/methylation domain-containing protein